MRENNIPLYALETKDPINEFNFLAFTLQYEMSYTNILNMLNMGGIPLRASERTEKDPLVIAGGPCAYNPEPLYDIVDIFQLGEGEEGLNDLLDLYQKHKDNFNKEAYLREASHIPSVYIPSLYDVTYNEDGTIKEFIPKYDDVPKKVKKIFKNYIDLDKMSRKEVNFKSKLIEWSQKSKVEVSFELIEQFLDEDYNPMFHTEIRIEGISAGKGTGYSKKESQQNAAQAALKKIKNDASFKEQIEATKAQNHLPENTEETDELTEETLIEENLETILPVENPETDECKGE